MAEGARLESVYTATYRGFESPPHRHILRRARTQVRAFFACSTCRGDENPRTGVRQLATPVGRDREPASGLPRRGERSESIPPHRHILRRARTQVRAFFACSTCRGDENSRPGVRQLATPVGQTASLRAGCPYKNAGSVFEQRLRWPRRARPMDGPSNGERSESIPPHRHILRRARTHVRAFSHVAPQHPRGRQQCLSRATRPYPPDSPAKRSAAGRMPKTTKPGLARALLTV